MIEFDPNTPDGDDHELTPPPEAPDDRADPAFAEQHMPPLDDLTPDPDTMPNELHFPGEDAAATDADPSAPWPDDDEFSQWLAGPEPTGSEGDPAADRQLRDQLAPPPEDSADLPSSDALVDWTLRGQDH